MREVDRLVSDALNLENARDRGDLHLSDLCCGTLLGAAALGKSPEAALLGILFSFAEGLERYAVTRTRRSLHALLELVPTTVRLISDGHEVVVGPEAFVEGDLFLPRRGERAATDGVIRRGSTSLNTSVITGETVPKGAGPGDEVSARAINVVGAIEVEVTAPAADGSLARIVHIIEESHDRKGIRQRLADRVARPLVPATLIFATAVATGGLLMGSTTTAIERALVVLVAASPCALAMSVPLTVVAAVGVASKNGALVKGGRALEELGGIRAVALDKSGALTCDRPDVVAVVLAAGVSRADVLETAALLEARSEHPGHPAVAEAAVPRTGALSNEGYSSRSTGPGSSNAKPPPSIRGALPPGSESSGRASS